MDVLWHSWKFWRKINIRKSSDRPNVSMTIVLNISMFYWNSNCVSGDGGCNFFVADRFWFLARQPTEETFNWFKTKFTEAIERKNRTILSIIFFSQMSLICWNIFRASVLIIFNVCFYKFYDNICLQYLLYLHSAMFDKFCCLFHNISAS